MFITISRQFAAGASEVSRRVAEELGWKVVDDAFIEEIAARTGYTPEDIAGLEERVPSFMERFAQSSAISLPENLLSSPSSIDQPDTIKLAHVSRELVEELGREDRVVLVGRAAAAVLASESSAIHVRLVASVEYRVQQAIRRLGHSEKQARAAIAESDRNRELYHRELYGRDWNDPVNYHMVFNTEVLGPEGAAQLVVARARQLGW
jgi:cytidylate kinase